MSFHVSRTAIEEISKDYVQMLFNVLDLLNITKAKLCPTVVVGMLISLAKFQRENEK